MQACPKKFPVYVYLYADTMGFQRKKRPAGSAPPSTDEVLLRLEQFCAFRERSPKEVRDRLAELGLNEETAEQIYASLLSDKFFDEERFARAFAYGKFRSNHWGKVRIRQELRMRDIDPEIIRLALDEIGEEEYTGLLRQLLEKRRRELDQRADDNARQKTAAAMIRAGFEPDLVFRYL
jgi:regulatory protein